MWENRDIKLVTTEAITHYVVSEPSYHITIFFRKFISHRNEIKKTLNIHEQTSLMWEISKIVLCEFCDDCVKPQYRNNKKCVT